MLNFLELNNDYKKMYKTNLIKLNEKFFEIGNIDGKTGQNTDVYGRIRLKDYISVNPRSKYLVKANVNLNIGIRFYDKNKNYIGLFSNIRRVVFDTPVNCYYIRFIIEKSKVENIRGIFEPLIISPNLKINLTFETGSINYSTGKDQNLASTLRTDFIEVQENETYKLRYYNENIVYGLRCYDKDKNYLNGQGIETNIITIPSGTSFIRLIRKDLSKPNEYLERIWKLC